MRYLKGLTKTQVEDLLQYMGVSKIMPWKGNKIQFCCPVHGESHPSCGINIDYSPDGKPNEHLQVFHCFSCGAGGTIPHLLHKALPDRFRSVKEAKVFIQNKYGVTYTYSYGPATKSVKRYEEMFDSESSDFSKPTLPITTLAPFKSGKETYQYFFNRGFDKEDMKKFMIGRDLNNETVTIPAFWEDGTLAGVIGRYVDQSRPKNMRYKIYSFPKGKLIYPLDKLQVVKDTIIGVEAMFDCMMLHKWGFPNTVAMMGDGMSVAQADQIAKRCRIFIDLFDNDKGGDIARNIAKSRLGNRVLYLTPTYYPDFGKDPSEWGEIETLKVIKSATYTGHRKIPRL